MATPNTAVSRRLAAVAGSGLMPMAGMPTPPLATDTTPGTAGLNPNDAPPGLDIKPTPAINLAPAIAPPAAPDQDGVRAALSRALIGFSRGVAATPQNAYGDTALGGITGGLSAIGQGAQQDRMLQWQMDGPRRAVVQKMLETQAEEQAKYPYKAQEEAGQQANRLELQDRKLNAMRDLAKDARGRAALASGLPDAVEKEISSKADMDLIAGGGITPFDERYAQAYPVAYNKRLQEYQTKGVTGAGKGKPLPVPAAPAQPQLDANGRKPLDSFFNPFQ